MTDALADAPAPPPTTADELRVLLVHGEDLAHWGFRAVLSRQFWVEQLMSASDPTEALELAPRLRPHVVVTDAHFRGESGLDLCDRLHETSPGTRVVLLSTEGVPAAVRERSGLAGAVPKWWRAEDIASAVRSVGLGMTVFAPELDEVHQLLTAREQRILQMLTEGDTNREIAERLQLSAHTVKDHVSGIYRKLEARNRAEAIVRGQRLGLIG